MPRTTVTRARCSACPGRTRRASTPMMAPTMMVPMIVNDHGSLLLRGRRDASCSQRRYPALRPNHSTAALGDRACSDECAAAATCRSRAGPTGAAAPTLRGCRSRPCPCSDVADVDVAEDGAGDDDAPALSSVEGSTPPSASACRRPPRRPPAAGWSVSNVISRATFCTPILTSTEWPFAQWCAAAVQQPAGAEANPQPEQNRSAGERHRCRRRVGSTLGKPPRPRQDRALISRAASSLGDRRRPGRASAGRRPGPCRPGPTPSRRASRLAARRCPRR